jgi:hypothetical protein
LIRRTPYPADEKLFLTNLAQITHRAWSGGRNLRTISETSHAFLLPVSLRPRLGEFSPPAIEAELERIQTEIDDQCFKLYGVEGEDRRQIEAWSSQGKAMQPEESSEPGDDLDEMTEDEAASTDELGSLLSWCVGVAFGRFDIRLATGERSAPPEPEPFDPLPKRSPGMLPEGDPPFMPNSGILVDDPGHPDGIIGAIRAVLERVGIPMPDTFRLWLAKEFFPLHIRMYSRSRRKAPIYWQVATPSGSYSIWLYIHAFSRDTLFRVQNDYVAPKLEHELRRLDSMRSGMSSSPKAIECKALAAQEAFAQELKDLLAELKLVTQFWEPELDDGVVINAAPLWRLCPQNKGWQKELRSVWDSLCAGKYDWSHMAMHLWPERVVPKCATDRSLALTHGLEDVFWVEGSDGRWKPQTAPTPNVPDLIAERSSTAIKAALEGLNSMPSATLGTKRGRAARHSG